MIVSELMALLAQQPPDREVMLEDIEFDRRQTIAAAWLKHVLREEGWSGYLEAPKANEDTKEVLVLTQLEPHYRDWGVLLWGEPPLEKEKPK